MQEILRQLQLIVKQHAAEQILSRYNQVPYRLKNDGSLVTEADSAMQIAMINSLNQCWPDYAILGEEMSAEQQQALLQNSPEGLWVLDPLDGTSNFASGLPIFSVSIALLIQNEVVLGMVYDPLRNEVFTAIKGEGAWLNGSELACGSERESLSECIAQLDFKRLKPEMRACLARDHAFASQRNFGSGALDWCWLAAGRSQIYIHGGQKLWDYAAGQLIFDEAGGLARTLQGEQVSAMSLEPRSVIASVSQGLYQQLQAYLASLECDKEV
ncbi:Inositol-1-monophosphatase [hydrothermal vent metagenome]|uniref:Inositol-1-monophosphatase n=1 Tax=hydrothermal vent metagenome TaxID=652676 RepID=A0A3B0XJB8_9ZZZZ